MFRRSYLVVLLLLQIAFAAEVAPPLARMLAGHVGAAASRGAMLGAIQLALAALAVAGLALVLTFPVVALARHHQRGAQRFRGVPRWAVALAFTGAAVFAGAVAVKLCRPLLPVEARTAAIIVARVAATAGVAAMAAGALCAELLRRSVAPAALTRPRPAAAPVEVTAPADLRTRAA